ncbi:MAG: hypothetical protein WCT14_14980, partial [Treponemataceae bacterium]
MMTITGLRNHIPLSGPATREPCDGTESPMRISIGFTPKWYRDRLGIDFGEPWHLDVRYRYEQSLRMRELLTDLFPSVDYFRANFRNGAVVGGHFCPECATISSVFGIMLVSSCYGLPVVYRPDNWPDATGGMHLSKEELSGIIASGPFIFDDPDSLPGGGKTVRSLFAQMDEIRKRWGPIHGYLNYQGILNIALKLRGNDLFTDLFDDPEFAKALFDHVAYTIGSLSKTVQARQRESGFNIDLLSMSNCVMSMVSPDQYEEFVLPLDKRLSVEYPRFGVHTCNWIIDPYVDKLRKIKRMDYIDTGLGSDLTRVKALFPDTRRAVLYTPGDAESKSLSEIAADLGRIAREYAPCDIVLADVETTVS